jgi:hypothetical protein
MGGAATHFSLDQIIKLHRGFVTRGEYRRLGRLEKIVLAELPKDVQHNLSPGELAREGRSLDWMGTGPALALSPGDVDLLVVSPVGELPEKPDPDFQAPIATQQEIERAIAEHGKWSPAKAPMRKQKPEDRGATRIKGTNILVFEPVHDVLFRVHGIVTWGQVSGFFDQASKTHLAFLWDFENSIGLFYGGRFQIKI